MSKATVNRLPSADTEMQAELARLRAENAALKAKAEKKRTLTLKVSEARPADPKAGRKATKGGGVSLYGIRRFPLTFYREEWERILAIGDDILAFIKENEDKLTSKDDVEE